MPSIKCRCGHDDTQHAEPYESKAFRARISPCGASQLCGCLRFVQVKNGSKAAS